MGLPFDSIEAIAVGWREFFREQEDGVVTSLSELMEAADERHLRIAKLQPPGNMPWEHLPSRQQIENQFRRVAIGKSFFADGSPGDVLKKAPAKMTELFYTLYLKEVAYNREPLAHKGGYLVPAFKRGDARLMRNYRSLFVSSVIAKALHSVYRRELVQIFQPERLSMQIITQPVHTPHLFQKAAKHAGDSAAFLFLDVTNAFYRLVREHIVGSLDQPRATKDLFDQLGLPLSCYEEFAAMLAEPSAIEASSAPEHLKEMFRSFYTGTWFKIRNDKAVVETRRGSRPGDSFANLCFSFALTKVLKPAIEAIR